MTEFADKVAIKELEGTIKKQNQTLLRISAELEAIKQCDPFNSVFIAYSVENISNMIETLTEQSINEECVGCAGPCKVVDVAAKLQTKIDMLESDVAEHERYLDLQNNLATGLQKELVDTTAKLVDSRKRCDYLSTKINEKQGLYDELERTCGDLRAELFDLKNAIPDNFWAVVTEKDSMIRRQGKIIEDFKTIETKETDRLHKIILDMDVTISDLMDNDRKINGFLDEYRVTVENRDKAIEDQKRTIDHFINCIGGLEVELSVRKEDSAVLMKVVEIVREWQNLSAMVSTYDMRRLRDLVQDYLDAPEGQHETPIDDLYKVTVTYAFLEMP